MFLWNLIDQANIHKPKTIFIIRYEVWNHKSKLRFYEITDIGSYCLSKLHYLNLTIIFGENHIYNRLTYKYFEILTWLGTCFSCLFLLVYYHREVIINRNKWTEFDHVFALKMVATACKRNSRWVNFILRNKV